MYLVVGDTDYGVFYGGDGVQLGVQLLGIVVISLWTMTLSLILFLSMMFTGTLRVPKNDEIMGLDISQHGGCAYGEDGPKKIAVSPLSSSAN